MYKHLTLTDEQFAVLNKVNYILRTNEELKKDEFSKKIIDDYTNLLLDIQLFKCKE